MHPSEKAKVAQLKRGLQCMSKGDLIHYAITRTLALSMAVDGNQEKFVELTNDAVKFLRGELIDTTIKQEDNEPTSEVSEEAATPTSDVPSPQ